MKYALRLHTVFDSIEESKEILKDVVEFSEKYGIEEHPNYCDSNTDFDLWKSNNKNVFDFINKLKLKMLLHQADIDKKHNTYQKLLDNIDEYMSEDDINYYQIISLLKTLIKNESNSN